MLLQRLQYFLSAPLFSNSECRNTKITFLCVSGIKSQREELDSILFIFEVSHLLFADVLNPPLSLAGEHNCSTVVQNCNFAHFLNFPQKIVRRTLCNKPTTKQKSLSSVTSYIYLILFFFKTLVCMQIYKKHVLFICKMLGLQVKILDIVFSPDC